MSLPLKLDFSNYDKFLTDPNYTTSAEAQDYFRNMDMLVEALIDVGLWQPETNYPNGHVVFSPNMPNGTEAVCVATTGGKSSNTEPSWGEVGGDNVSDGTCFWKLRYKHWSKSVASVEDMLNGTSNDKVVTPYLATLGQTATNRLPNKAYAVGNVVYVDSNLSVALKCKTAGTTSNTELDISTKNIGDTVTDGSVVWQVCNRTSDVTSVNGKTGNVTVDVPVTSVNGQVGDVTVDVPVTSVNGQVGDVTVSGGNTVSVTGGTLSTKTSATIPLPDGFTRSQCRYAVWLNDVAFSTIEFGEATYLKLAVDQSNGAVTVQYTTSTGGSGTQRTAKIGYLCVAVK